MGQRRPARNDARRLLEHVIGFYEVLPLRPLVVEGFGAREKANPIGPLIEALGCRVLHDRIDKAGRVTLRYRER